MERILAAPGSASKELWIVEDVHLSDRLCLDAAIRSETAEVISWIKAQRNVRHIQRAPHSHFNNSWSILEAYKDAYYAGFDWVYMIEDDVMVMDDFFEWNERLQQKETFFVSCAERHNASLNINNVVDRIDEAAEDSYVFSKYAYSSLGVCFPRASIALIAEKLATKAFCDWIDQDHKTQQDEAIQNLMWSVDGRSVWSIVPRALHEGWYGTGCTIAQPPSGSLSERIDYIRKVLSGEVQPKPIGQPRWGHSITTVKSWSQTCEHQ